MKFRWKRKANRVILKIKKIDMDPELTAFEKALRTGKWAKIMTKWRITSSNKGGKRWHFVSLDGTRGPEARGIVDLIAIRRDQKCKEPYKRGDCFEIILIQVKGGSASWPSVDDIRRLKAVRKYYKAKRVILSEWKKGNHPTLFRLKKTSNYLLNSSSNLSIRGENNPHPSHKMKRKSWWKEVDFKEAFE